MHIIILIIIIKLFGWSAQLRKSSSNLEYILLVPDIFGFLDLRNSLTVITFVDMGISLKNDTPSLCR